MSDEPQLRQAARLIVLDELGQVLLLQGRDPADPTAGTWWFTPGGGIDAGETAEQAARREFREETGVILEPPDLGPVVLTGQTSFSFDGVAYDQRQVFYRVDTKNFTPDTSGWTAGERDSILGWRWWPLDALRACPEPIYPVELIDYLAGRLDPP